MLSRIKRLPLITKLALVLVIELVVLVFLYSSASSSSIVLGPSNLVDGSCSADNTPTLTFTKDGQADVQLQIDDTSNFSSPVVDYTTMETSFTVGQAEGSGTYITGSQGQTLADGNYYWRVIVTTDGGNGDCGECDGQVTNFTLRYDGSQSALVKVEQRSDHAIVFEDTVEPGELFSFSGTWIHDIFGPLIIIYVDGEEHTSIHTSCSLDVGPGYVSGDFTVIEGDSRNGGPLCPVNGGGPEEEIVVANNGNVAFRVDTTPPTIPCPTSDSGIGDNTPTWTWNASVDVGCGLDDPSYTVEWSQDENFESGVSTATTNTNSFTHVIELSNGTWYFRVKSVDVVGNESEFCEGVTEICVGCGTTNGNGNGNGQNGNGNGNGENGNGGNGNGENGNGEEESFGLVVRTLCEEDRPIPGCSCTVLSEPQTATTNEEGECSFENLEVGEHRVVCTCGAYTQDTTVNVTGEEGSTLSVVQFDASCEDCGIVAGASCPAESACSPCVNELVDLVKDYLKWGLIIFHLHLLLLLLLFLLYRFLSRRKKKPKSKPEKKSDILKVGKPETS